MSILRKHLDGVTPYRPPLDSRDPLKFLLLDFNERTEPISQLVEDRLIDFVRSGNYRLYPAYGDLDAKIASYVSLSPENVLLTNGSDEAIALCVLCLTEPGDEVILLAPGFDMYEQSARAHARKVSFVRYEFPGRFPTQELCDAVGQRTKLIFIPSPNNPTGTGVTLEDIEAVLSRVEGRDIAVVVDECYFEYARVTATPLIERFENLLITRTFSKTWGLAGFRMGYLLGQEQIVSGFKKVRSPYSVNQMAVVAASAALECSEYVRVYVDEVLKVSKPLLETFLKERKIPFWESQANFIFAYIPDSDRVCQVLLEHHVRVRPKKDADGQLGLRITIGNGEQTQRLIDVLSKI